MSNHSRSTADLPLQQKAIQDQCFHRTGTFIKFDEEEREQAISDRFEHQVMKYPDRLALKMKTHELTYAELNKTSNRVAHAVLAQQGTGAERIALLLEPGAPAHEPTDACRTIPAWCGDVDRGPAEVGEWRRGVRLG